MKTRIKKTLYTTALLITILLSSCTAYAEISFNGEVIASETVPILAPFGGMIDKTTLRVGDLVGIGDEVASITTTKVYATVEGTVSGVFALEGDDATAICERYGGVVYIEPINRYIVSASTEKAYNSGSTKYIHIGEKVNLSCTKDGSHTGTAIVTSISKTDESGNTSYMLEVVGGSFYIGEVVGIFRSEDYNAKTRIGRGTIQQNTAIAAKGTGSILRMHVKEGDNVERGELLFETVEGTLDGLYAIDNTIVSHVAGVVASVDIASGSTVGKGEKLITVYPSGSFQIEILISEMDLKELKEGDFVDIEFGWDMEGNKRLKGIINSISYINSDPGNSAYGTSNAEYSAYIDFDASDDVRLGMSAIIYLSANDSSNEGIVVKNESNE